MQELSVAADNNLKLEKSQVKQLQQAIDKLYTELTEVTLTQPAERYYSKAKDSALKGDADSAAKMVYRSLYCLLIQKIIDLGGSIPVTKSINKLYKQYVKMSGVYIQQLDESAKPLRKWYKAVLTNSSDHINTHDVINGLKAIEILLQNVSRFNDILKQKP